jgi:hypothetical protein
MHAGRAEQAHDLVGAFILREGGGGKRQAGQQSNESHDETPEERMFFFEKKNQKTFATWACLAGEGRDSA